MRDRPTQVTVIAWIVLAFSTFAALLMLRHFQHGTSQPVVDAYELTTALIKIAAAAGMLRCWPLARTVFLWTYGLCAVVADALAYGHDWFTEGQMLIVSYLMNALLFLTYAILLTRPSVDGWFGGKAWGFGLVERAAGSFTLDSGPARPRRFAGGLVLAASGGVLAFLGYHVVLDLLTLRYVPTEALVLSADIREPEVEQVESTDPGLSPDQRRNRSVTRIRTFDPKVHYRYAFRGITYESHRFATMGTTVATKAKAARARYVPEAKVTAWVDPQDPSQAVLERGVSPYYLFGFFALILLMFGRALWSGQI